MMNKIFTLLFYFSLIFIISCEDNINIKSDFEEEPILFCIINMEDTSQYAIVKRSFDDRNNVEENYISDVKIILSSNTQTAELESKEGDGIDFPKNYYSTNSFNPKPGSNLSLEATLPTGSVLRADIIPPRFSLLYFEQTELYIPFGEFSDQFLLNWNINTTSVNIAYVAFLFIDYSILKNGEEVIKRMEIPITHVDEGDQKVPIYSTVTKNTYQIFNQKSIDESLMNISEGDTNKVNYKILGGIVEFYVLEENLASYFASIETFKNTYSVKVYENIISNIAGGTGVFGAYYKRDFPVRFSNSYIRSFGYSTNQ